MRKRGIGRGGWKPATEMALAVLFLTIGLVSAVQPNGEMALANVTRFSSGDLFALVGSDCGPTRCMEVSHGTALAAMGGGDACVCQCRRETPAFREDQRICVNHIDECQMASFGRGSTKPQIPFVFLPLKGQIIYPSKEIIFTDVEDAICAVTSAQYLSSSGWVTLRDLLDNDVPFSLYRDEGSTFLQWRGSAALHARLEGRLVAAHVLCSTLTPTRLAASCAAFRVAGATHNALLDVSSIPFHAGEIVTTEAANQNQGLSVLEALAIGVCVLMLIFVYAAGIIFYIHYKQRQRRKEKDPEMSNTLSTENGSLGSRFDLDNVMMKTNPLLKMDNFVTDFAHDAGLSDVSEHTEDTLDSSTSNSHKFQKLSSSPNNMHKKLNSSVISAMVHSRRKKPSRPSIRTATGSGSSTPERMTERLQRRSASPDIERVPHSEMAIVDCSVENDVEERQPSPSSNGESAIRRKLYFNPVFFETEHLKNPPPAAVEFLVKIREVMSIAKDKMTTKRFIPSLSDIPEEESHHSIDLGWDIPCARRGRRFSAISLKRENSRKAVHCGGCPGCDSREPVKSPTLTRSNSCKSCVSEDYKQRIVRKWLDEVPPPAPRIVATKPVKSIAKVSGTPRVISPKSGEEENVSSPELSKKENVKSKNTKVVDVPLKDQVRAPRIKEAISKKDIHVIREPQIVSQVSKQLDALRKEESMKPQIVLAKPKTAVSENTGPSKIPASASTPPQEKKSPSSHISRRIRKKLPPPPPPPITTSKLKISQPMPIEIETEPEPPKPEEPPIPPEVKIKMEAVIRELNKCRRAEPENLQEIKPETIEPIPPKIVIPVTAAPDTHYFSDDNIFASTRKKNTYVQYEPFIDLDSLERSMLKKRRFSLACGPELAQTGEMRFNHRDMKTARETLTRSWRDVRKAIETYHFIQPRDTSVLESRSSSVSEIFVDTSEPLYDNLPKPGPLTIQVRGSPVEIRRNKRDEFDPDTLDRKPKREVKKRVEKILLKSGGSFKNKGTTHECSAFKHQPEPAFTREIGSLRQIYEAKAKEEERRMPYYERRGSVPYGGQELAALVKSVKTADIIRQLETQREPPKPPIPPKLRRGADLSPKFANTPRDSPGEKRRSAEERERYSQYLKAENIIARRSGRRSNRTRSRRTDLRKLYRTEDSGYLSTDSNESKRRANYLMQLKPKTHLIEQSLMAPSPTIVRTPILQHIESDTDDMESICDGRSESGGESIETDSVFFGNFDESKQMFADLGMTGYDIHRKLRHHEQIDSGFMGETNIILSGDSDSEHRSVISIVTGRDGRASAASFTQLDEPPYVHSVEC